MSRVSISDIRLVTKYGDIYIREVEKLSIKNGVVNIRYRGVNSIFSIEDVFVDGDEICLNMKEVIE